MSTAAVRRYWTTLADFGCVICGSPAEIAHCHGGSIVERCGVKAKGVKLAFMDWVVLPLCPPHGRHPHAEALDTNVAAWEEKFGSQVSHIDRLIGFTGVDVWKLAKSRHDRITA